MRTMVIGLWFAHGWNSHADCMLISYADCMLINHTDCMLISRQYVVRIVG